MTRDDNISKVSRTLVGIDEREPGPICLGHV